MMDANRRRVCFISSPGHRDYVLTFGKMLSKSADLLLIVEDTVSEGDAAAVGAGKAVRLPWPRHRDALGNVRHLARIKAEIDAFSPDVVHVVAEGQVWFTALKTILGSRPLVVTLHDVHTHPGDKDSQTIPRPIINAFVRSADAVIVHGEGLKSDAQASLRLHPDRYDLRPRRIDDLETAQLFTDADVLVLPYIEASQSGVLAIAPSFGLPVVASDIGEIGDVVRTTGMGLLVPPADPPALAKALREVLENDDLRAELARKSAEAATGALSPERIWTLTQAAYDGAIRHARRDGQARSAGAVTGLTSTTT